MLFVFCFPYLSLKYGLSITQCLSQKCHTDHEKKFRFVQLMDLFRTEIRQKSWNCEALRTGPYFLCVLDDEQTVRDLKPDLEKIKQIDGLLVHVTARGTKEDCVSRSFAPKLSVAEDPVCGSGHCHIIPYWKDVLGKNELVAYQASKRGGTLYCRQEGEKIFMAGKAALYSIDELFI